LWIGSTSANTRASPGGEDELLVIEPVDVDAGQQPAGVDPDGGGDVAGGEVVVAGDHAQPDAGAGQLGDHPVNPGLGRVQEGQEPHEGELPLMVGRDLQDARQVAFGHGRHPVAGVAQLAVSGPELAFEPVVQRDDPVPGGHAGADPQHRVERPLGDQLAPARAVDEHAQALTGEPRP
jgi:hypothetical protein